MTILYMQASKLLAHCHCG